MPNTLRRAGDGRAGLLALLLFLFCGAAAGCATYDITIEPPPLAMPARTAADRPVLSIAVRSTYAPFADGVLSTTDLYPRDQQLGLLDADRYRRAFAATWQFAEVKLADASSGLHCRLVVVSGREPPREWRRVLSILFTAGLLAHEQREIVQLEATVAAPWRSEARYRLEAKITSNAVSHDNTRLHRSGSFSGPEYDLAAAVVALMVNDGWLDRGGAAQ